MHPEGYAKTITAFLPKLRAAGATADALYHIMVDNPRRFLAFVPKGSRRENGRQCFQVLGSQRAGDFVWAV
jgi:hypothetical protein